MGLFDLLRRLLPFPGPAQMAAQLRRPTGVLSRRVATKMNQVNGDLYALVFRSMDLPVDAQVLELGPGNGRTSLPLFHQRPGLRYTGLDYSADMVVATRSTLATHIAAGQANVLQGSSDRMPFQEATFDVVYGVNTIYFWDDVAAHLAEIRRVLKPGGQLVTGYRDEASMKDLPFVQHGFAMYTVEQWEGVLRDAGFSAVHSATQAEPDRQWQGRLYAARSCCTVATK